MRTIALSTLIYISAPDATAAFHPTQRSTPTPGRKTSLDARKDYSGIDSLRARRLALRRPEPEPVQAVEEEYEYVAPLEYLYDRNEIRDDDAPFRVLLLPSTFNDHRTQVEDIASSCVQVLDIPYDKAYELSMFAKYESFSVLGTWTRKESIAIGEKLTELNIECRLVPIEEEYDEWKCPDFMPDFNLDSGSEIEAELTTFMEMRQSHDQDLKSFMQQKKEQQRDEHPDTFSLSS